MANITRTKTQYLVPVKVTPSAAVAANDTIEFDGMDERTLLLFNVTGAGNVVIEAGDNIQGVADLTLTFGETGMFAITLEAMGYKKTKGANKGKVVIKSKTATATLSVVEIFNKDVRNESAHPQF